MAKTKAARPKAAAKKRAPATHPRHDEADLIADARLVYTAAKKKLADFVNADVKRKAKRVTAAGLTQYLALIAKAQAAHAGQPTRVGAVKTATASEASLRKQIATAGRGVRDDVKESYPSNVALQEAFGRGFELQATVTSSVLDFADLLAEAYNDPKQRALAEDAGVTAETMSALATLRTSLAEADTTQNATLNARKGGTASKGMVFSKLEAQTAYIRGVANRLYATSPAKRKAFQSTVPRKITKKRVKPASSTGTPSEPTPKS